jgi:GNAT superfamily N-acetyltransferase
MVLPEKIRQAGISIHHDFVPGDLGRLIYIHGVQNFRDYGFNEIHEAYCAKIAIDFLLTAQKGRSRAWIPKKDNQVVGSVLIVERPENQAQLRLLFADDSVRGVGLGRWLVEESVRYSREAGFELVYLWTVAGLDRAKSVYESLGFVKVEEKIIEEWGHKTTEIRYDLKLR